MSENAPPTPTQSAPLVVLGLDSVPPELLFRRFLPVMPAFRQLLQRSVYGTLRSCDPPITVPAWAVMFSGRDPGTLGLYGFHHRRPGTYFDSYTPRPQMLRHPMLWDQLSRQGRRVAIIGMPPGYPPPTVNGVYVADLLTPPNATDIVTPASLRGEVPEFGGYRFDVTFRKDDRAGVAEELFDMTRQRWRLARSLWKRERWDFFAIHEIGPDRIHHAFWKYFDPEHPRHLDDPRFSRVAEDYYRLLDEEIAAFLDLVPRSATIFVASDHGSQRMEGCFCINDWLIAKGYLRLKRPAPAPKTPLDGAEVDWTRTKLWGAGGYYARIFVNQKGREPQGQVSPDERAPLLRELERDLSSIRRPDGSPLGVRLFEPQSVYREVNGDPPDLMAYFGDLKWRSAGTVGNPSLFLEENDTGPDDAVHSFEGVFVLADGTLHNGRELGSQSILDVAPTLMTRLGLKPPPDLPGRPIPELL